MKLSARNITWVAALVCVILLLWRLRSEPEPLPAVKWTAATVQPPTAPTRPPPVANPPAQPPVVPATAPKTPAPDADAVLANARLLMIRQHADAMLRMAEARAKLTLSQDEHEHLLGDILDCQHAVAMIDAPFVRVVSFDNATLVLDMAPHPTESRSLKTVFSEQVRHDLGSTRADEVLAALDSKLDLLFGGFGQFHRTFTVEKPRDDGQVHVSTNVTAPEGNADPTLDQRAKRMTGNGWFSRDILDMEYEAIISAIDQHFPKIGAAESAR